MSDEAFPIITLADLLATEEFYRGLGFRETYRFPTEGDADFVVPTRGSSSIGIGLAFADEEPFSYWVYVDDVDSTVRGLGESGVPIHTEPQDQPWGERVARTRDPAGNMVILGQRVR